MYRERAPVHLVMPQVFIMARDWCWIWELHPGLPCGQLEPKLELILLPPRVDLTPKLDSAAKLCIKCRFSSMQESKPLGQTFTPPGLFLPLWAYQTHGRWKEGAGVSILFLEQQFLVSPSHSISTAAHCLTFSHIN